MSWKYSITIKLDAAFIDETIKTILCHGSSYVVYYKFGNEEGYKLSPEEATQWILSQHDINFHTLLAKINGIYTDLNFLNHNGLITILLSGISHENLKKFKYDHEDIDIASYIKILLDLTQDFRILALDVRKD